MSKTFSTLKKVILYTISILSLLAITGYVYLYVLPKGPEISEKNKINSGIDSFVIHAYKESKRKSIRVWTYKPEGWEDQDKIVFVMHGGGRNADDYLDAWTEIAEENNLLVVAPEFENKFYKYTTNDYQEGNLFTFFGTSNPKSEWAYTVVENIFDYIKSTNNITNERYYMFGHSAGGQFVHRMVILMPEARIETAVAANAGFYSFPDESIEYPYGLKNTGISLENDLQKSYKKKLIVLLGELDNDPALGTFRTTELAMKQGGHRLERGSNFFKMNQELSNQYSWTFNWKIDTVSNVGHDYRKMSENSVGWILD
ncbi:hypothetical protein [Mangrovivirga cuniculi]|uniref:Alpha/beta hydrolase n=1 Tax=Mangrovivirga cuniculi TaxID=2715131 RepID=A0A4D7K8L7_9BACT|nr:hypothetical protein [Mangrovivirga cuniculi]QCK15618.1 hypothetical protein DCC35_13120 [Mangrovivirga cuniculi]